MDSCHRVLRLPGSILPSFLPVAGALDIYSSCCKTRSPLLPGSLQPALFLHSSFAHLLRIILSREVHLRNLCNKPLHNHRQDIRNASNLYSIFLGIYIMYRIHALHRLPSLSHRVSIFSLNHHLSFSSPPNNLSQNEYFMIVCHKLIHSILFEIYMSFNTAVLQIQDVIIIEAFLLPLDLQVVDLLDRKVCPTLA